MEILRQLFGPSQKEVWRQLSSELGARYVDGTFFKSSKVQVTHGQWTLTLDSYTVSTGKSNVTYTRFRAPYVNPDGFRFTIYRSNLFYDIAKKLGMSDVEVGYPEFDRQFIIKGNSEAKLCALFASAQVRDRLLAYPDVCISVLDSEGLFTSTFPPDTDELLFTLRYTNDIELLKHYFELLAAILDQLCHIGSAYEDKPDVTL